MDISGQVVRYEEESVSCQICTVPYELESIHLRPHLLVTCGHTFCFKCLQDLIIPSKKCPICRKAHTVKKTNTAGLGLCRNYALEDIIERRKEIARQQFPDQQQIDFNQPRPTERRQFYCISCLAAFEISTNGQGILEDPHSNHRWIELSTLDPDIAKQVRWLFSLLENRDFEFLRSKILISSLQNQTKSLVETLERVENHFNRRDHPFAEQPAELRETLLDELKDDLIRAFIEGPNGPEELRFPKLISDLCELWSFEVKSALPIAELINRSSCELSGLFNTSLISDLKKDWDLITPIGLPQRTLTLLELACVSCSGRNFRKGEVVNLIEIIKTQSISLPAKPKPKRVLPRPELINLEAQSPRQDSFRPRRVAIAHKRELQPWKFGPLSEQEQEPIVFGQVFYQEEADNEHLSNNYVVEMPEEPTDLELGSPDMLGKRNSSHFPR